MGVICLYYYCFKDKNTINLHYQVICPTKQPVYRCLARNGLHLSCNEGGMLAA